LLISFLRSKLKNPEFKDRYKDMLLKMINDFYSPDEIEFQQAAYYAYLGELQKSLEIYLDLEKKSAQNPRLRSAPKHNIANVLYEQGRFAQALRYYEDALADLISGKVKVGGAGKSVMMDSINDRIEEIKAKLNL
jgi:tetratricopeptide (TPR) repeat protein